MNISDFEHRLTGRVPGVEGVSRHYAVLVPLVEREGVTSLLLEVRAETLHRQPGEVCFPGGRMEPGESPTQCAYRETWEELGIPASAIRPIARLDVLHHQSNYLLHPVLAQLDERALDHLRLETAEVKETFLVPVSFFEENAPLVYTYPLRPEVGEDFPYDLIGFREGYDWKAGRVEVPIWNYEGRAVWGITGRIIRWLMSELRS